MGKVFAITARLLWRKRWLFLLLLLWPPALAMTLRLGGGALERTDVDTLLQQEYYYGLALVAFTGSSILGAEQDSRRILVVLARAVGRTEYLAAVWLAAWLPMLLYCAGFLAGWAILEEPFRHAGGAVWMLLSAGAGTSSVSVFWSVLLRPAWAAIVTVAMAALLFAGPLAAGPGSLAWNTVATGVAAAAFAAASSIFRRRDLQLNDG